MEDVGLGQERVEPIRDSRGAPLSPENARGVIQGAWSIGRVHITPHFRNRSQERDFTTLDVGNVIRYGEMCPEAEFCEQFQSHKYRMRLVMDDSMLEIVLALDCAEDYQRAPLIVLVTAYWRDRDIIGR